MFWTGIWFTSLKKFKLCTNQFRLNLFQKINLVSDEVLKFVRFDYKNRLSYSVVCLKVKWYSKDMSKCQCVEINWFWLVNKNKKHVREMSPVKEITCSISRR